MVWSVRQDRVSSSTKTWRAARAEKKRTNPLLQREEILPAAAWRPTSGESAMIYTSIIPESEDYIRRKAAHSGGPRCTQAAAARGGPSWDDGSVAGCYSMIVLHKIMIEVLSCLKSKTQITTRT